MVYLRYRLVTSSPAPSFWIILEKNPERRFLTDFSRVVEFEEPAVTEDREESATLTVTIWQGDDLWFSEGTWSVGSSPQKAEAE